MNPFKQKQLEEFTIADCELYISKYPYGEHVLEVKRTLRELKKQKRHQSETANINNHKQSDKPQEIEIKNEARKTYSNKQKPTIQIKNETSSSDIVKTIFTWIGTIVVVLVVGTIIISILNEVLPYDWWNKYRYIIYPAVWSIGRWLQDKFD